MSTTHETIRYAADTVLLHRDENDELQVLLIQRRWDPHAGAWALPGGHVDPGETADQAATRELGEETGIWLEPTDLTLVGVFDGPGRDPRGRYVSVAYTALVVGDRPEPAAADDATQARWLPVGDPGPLAFDHDAILATALNAGTVS